MTASESTLTRERIVDDLAEMLGVGSDELGDDVNVLDMGLDSVRLMSLVERWRAAGAVDVDLVTLAEVPEVGAWVRELTGQV
ncbi:isochorismatase [Gordonia sp. PDNC005]|jgi:aryl carrier-like protein|uniref:phosphopantetheine-binding protein n=1 Tax=unclassified Gordonia (in: high G+C Gram-positive bacteria) TaxID=2657482 RepID=UPI0019646C16|nr:phosphopantetheine-binding protein [Gordonia sp. PDNC005]QRY64337.1 isochorismatase [Gordonia sp. PDNC005]